MVNNNVFDIQYKALCTSNYVPTYLFLLLFHRVPEKRAIAIAAAPRSRNPEFINNRRYTFHP